MKKLLLLGLILVLSSSCKNNETRFTTTSAEIDVVKALINDYHNGDWENSRRIWFLG